MTLVSISKYGYGLRETVRTCGWRRTASPNRLRIVARPQRVPQSAPRICAARRQRHGVGHRFAAEAQQESR
jgi:hypothetical protein